MLTKLYDLVNHFIGYLFCAFQANLNTHIIAMSALFLGLGLVRATFAIYEAAPDDDACPAACGDDQLPCWTASPTWTSGLIPSGEQDHGQVAGQEARVAKRTWRTSPSLGGVSSLDQISRVLIL